MTKVARRARFNAQPPKVPGTAMVIFKGVMVSLLVSLVAVLFLAFVSLVTDGSFIENYIRYIMVGITVASIFIGSAYAAQKAGSAGLFIGASVGIIYVLISVAIGLEVTPDTVSFLVLVNKLVAGIAAGTLGGLIGVNL